MCVSNDHKIMATLGKCDVMVEMLLFGDDVLSTDILSVTIARNS